MKEKINFISETLKLEGLLEKTDSDSGVVITHPHPLYGGDMHNPIVITLSNAYREKGYTTLRFNFRGTGSSQGSFDNGRGEQTDVYSACEYLFNIGIKKIDLAGYSFGAWVNAHINSKDATVENMVMISPPVGFIDFASANAIPALKLVVTGSRDDIAPATMIQKVLSGWNKTAQFKIIEGADHFYSGKLRELELELSKAL